MLLKKSLVLLSMATAFCLSTPVMANEAQQATLNSEKAFEQDINQAFEQSTMPMQVVLLSSQEMTETKGASGIPLPAFILKPLEFFYNMSKAYAALRS